MTRTIVKKTIARIFVLRVSGKGDKQGSANQLEVLRGYEHVPGVTWLLENFDIAIMQASSARGRRLRSRWQRELGMELLRRRGRDDFLGVSVVVGSTRFVIYASSASLLDEESGNAFTRHLIRYIKDPAFTGHADPDFMARRDAGTLPESDHPSVCNAFDATRFVRSLARASELWEAAKWARAAFDVKDVRVDPEGGEAQELVWQFLAYGSQMEVEIGKLRRFVGRLNLARSGYFPYREESAPLGFTTSEGKSRSLRVRGAEVESVAALHRIGMATQDWHRIATELGTEYRVASADQKTKGTLIHKLQYPAVAARRLYLTRKLLAYRDGELELRFVGVMANRLQPGSGHVLSRRWLGLNAAGEHDQYGVISYRIPALKPMVLDDAGMPRPGWLPGLSAEAEHEAWTALIAKHGWEDDGAARAPEAAEAAETALLDTPTARSGARRLDEPVMALSRLCLYRDRDAGPDGPRTKLFSRASSGRYELRREHHSASPDGGVRYDKTALIASWPDHELRGHVATLLRQVAHRLLDAGHHLGPLPVTVSTSASADRQVIEDDAAATRLRAEARKQRALAQGYERAEAAELGGEAPDEERLDDLRVQARGARKNARALEDKANAAASAAARPTSMVDFGQLRDVIAALEGVYAHGVVPPALNRLLRDILPGGIRFAPGPDSITLRLIATVELPLADDGAITVSDEVLIPHAAGRGATDLGEQRVADLARRYMHDGHPIEQVAYAARIKNPEHMLRMIREALSCGSRRTDGVLDRDEQRRRMPEARLRGAAFACPIPELRAVIWHRLTGTTGRPGTASKAYADLVSDLYFSEPDPNRDRGSKPDYGRQLWAWGSNTDRRLDQHTILAALPGPDKQMRADHLGAALAVASVNPRAGQRLVHESSVDHPRNGHVYPRTLRRLPALGHPDGWYGRQANTLADADKLVALPTCPHPDCPERYATAIVFAPEVLHFGTAMLCRRCKRPAADTPEARRTVFPDSAIAWADAQPRRTGRWVSCARPGCCTDVGAGPGRAWQWDDTPGPVWHDDTCRTGAQPPAPYRQCRYADCTLDEGGGPGSLDIAGKRATRRWHSCACQHAEDRRQRRLARVAAA